MLYYNAMQKRKYNWHHHTVVCINVDLHLIADQRNFTAEYLQNSEENELKSRSISF